VLLGNHVSSQVRAHVVARQLVAEYVAGESTSKRARLLAHR
jgi:hypothetical protein